MRHYPLVSLREVLTPTRDEIVIDPMNTYQTAGILSFGRGLFSRPPLVGSETSYTVYNRLHRDQIVYSRLFGWEGAVALVTPHFDGMYVSQEFPTFNVTCSRALPTFLGYVARWPAFHQDLARSTKGLGLRRQRVHPEQFLAVKIPLPDIEEQRRVVARLDGLLSRSQVLEARFAEDCGKAWLELLPSLVNHVLQRHANEQRRVRDLIEIVSDIVHPGDDLGQAREFVGLQHIESHSGRCIGSDAIGNEKGRKFRFQPGDVIFGYLRPYLNKVWLADRSGLCSVDQYVLRPRGDVDGDLLGFALRSRAVLDEAIAMTHSLQLPRLRSALLGSILVPWPKRLDVCSVRSRLESVSRSIFAAVGARRRQAAISRGLTPAILNRAFAGLL